MSKKNQNVIFFQVSSEIPMTYIDSNLPADSVIILTTDDVDGLNLDENRQLIVNQVKIIKKWIPIFFFSIENKWNNAKFRVLSFA